jgi:anionic cell wall polymer biosynthesis LytR-Cps2A-Psr (LCP) family protein
MNQDYYNHKNSIKKKKQIHIILTILLSIAIIGTTAWLNYVIFRNPDRLLVEKIFLSAIFVVISTVVFFGMNTVHLQEKETRFIIFRIIAVTVSVIYAVLCINSKVLNPTEVAEAQINEISNNNFSKKNKISFITLSDFNFEGFENYNIYNDKSLKIGYVDGTDASNMHYALDAIPEKTSYDTKTYKDYKPLVDALYNNEVDVIIMNELYRDAVHSIKTNFDSETVVISQTNVASRTDDVIYATDFFKKTTNVAFIGSFDDEKDGPELKAENNIILLATFNTETNQILLTSLPTNIAVPVGQPANDELLEYSGKFGSNGFSEGIIEAVHADFTKYVKFNMHSVKTLVDGLGKIDVNLSEAVRTDDYTFSAGNNEMTADEVVSLLTSDKNTEEAFEYQQQVFSGILSKLLSNKTALDSMELLEKALGTTERTIEDEFWYYLLENQYIKNPSWEIKTYNIEGEEADSIYSHYARRMRKTVEINEDELKEFLLLLGKMEQNEKI